jgi:hypothetical protein
MFKLQEKHGFSDDWASYVSGTLLEAGSDTTASIFLSFAVAMINFPKVQKKGKLCVSVATVSLLSPIFRSLYLFHSLFPF